MDQDSPLLREREKIIIERRGISGTGHAEIDSFSVPLFLKILMIRFDTIENFRVILRGTGIYPLMEKIHGSFAQVFLGSPLQNISQHH